MLLIPLGLSNMILVSAAQNFLDDDEPVAVVEDKSAEIGNVQNQLNSTNKSLATAKADRSAIEAEVANQAGHLASLQTQLSSAKAAFDGETNLLANFRERFNNQSLDINKAREELIRAESDLSALKLEKAEIEGTFMRDKEDGRDLNRKVIEIGQQVEATKVEVEKLKKDAKQQKGRLAIARKQLSTKEAERAKVQKELEDVQAELANSSAEADTLEAELAKPEPAVTNTTSSPSLVPAFATPERAFSSDSLGFAAATHMPETPNLGTQSPALSIGSAKSNNPFERLGLGGSPTSRSSSPSQAGPISESSPLSNGLGHELVPAEETKNTTPALNFADAFEDPSPAPSLSSPATVTGNDSTPATPRMGAPIAITLPEPTPKSSSEQEAVGTFVSPTTTIGSELFSTPPSSSADDASSAHQRSMTDATKTFPDLDLGKAESVGSTASDIFPGSFPLDPPAPSVPAADTTEKGPSTDLSANLKELDIDESDSSEDEDDIPLASIAKGKGKAKEENPITPVATGGSAFEDVFHVSPPEPVASMTNGASKDAFGFPDQNASSPFATNGNLFEASLPAKSPDAAAQSPVAGADAFDEAMGFKPTSAGPAQEFSFDNAFDDSFDFASATSFTPATNGDATNVNGGAPAKLDSSFDDIFSNSTAAPISPSAGPKTPVFSPSAMSPAAAATAPSFDAAFSGFDSSAADLSLNQPRPAVTQMASSDSSPFPTGPTSPKPDHSPPRVSKGSNRTASPPRDVSPKRARASTGSSKEGHEKVKETRTSKLSVSFSLLIIIWTPGTDFARVLRFDYLLARKRRKRLNLCPLFSAHRKRCLHAIHPLLLTTTWRP